MPGRGFFSSFFVSRTAHDADAGNVVNARRVTLRFQRSPGVPPVGFRGIEKLEYWVYWGGQMMQHGRTSDRKDGKVTVTVCPTAGTATCLMILGTDYEIRPIDDLAKPKTIRGIQQRLALLGYYSGALHDDETLAANDLDLYELPNVETERALLHFQADRGLFADALCGPKTRKELEAQVKRAGQVRVADANPSFYEQHEATLGTGDPRTVKLIHKSMRVVPVRFARAPDADDPDVASGDADAHAPDPDDRGWARCVKSNHRAYVLPVGFDENLDDQAVTRVRLIRENIADAAELYVTSSDDEKVEITDPTGHEHSGGEQVTVHKLPAQTNCMLKFRALGTGRCFLEVRYGAHDGPIIHRLQLVISSVRILQVKAHAPVLNSPNTETHGGVTVPAQSAYNTLPLVRGCLDGVNAIYFPYGIRFDVMAGVDTSVHANFSKQGCVDIGRERLCPTLNRMGSESTFLRLHSREENGAINMVFVPQIIKAVAGIGPGRYGGGALNAKNNAVTFGVLIAEWSCNAHTIAHELGHLLNLVNDPKTLSGASRTLRFVHVNTRDNRTRPALSGTGIRVRDDVISRRRLMWAFTGISARSLRTFPNLPYNAAPIYHPENIMAYRRNVGYGNDTVGTMLAVKQFDADRTDCEMQEVQKSAKWLLSRS